MYSIQQRPIMRRQMIRRYCLRHVYVRNRIPMSISIPRIHCTFISSRSFSTESSTKTTKITVSSASDKISHLRNNAHRIINTDMGHLNTASFHEACQCIIHLHSNAITDPTQEEYFNLTESLLLRLLEECSSKSVSDIEIPLDTINKALDCWKLIANAKVPFKSNRSNVVHRKTPFIDKGLALLHKVKQAAVQYQGTYIRIDHPDVKSYNIVMDVFAKFALVEDAKSLFDEMMSVSRNGQPQCRPETISYNILLLAHANAAVIKETAANDARDLFEEMFYMYSETANPDLKPDVVSYSTLLSAYANAASINPSFAEEAEKFLYRMMELSNVNPYEWERPNEICFNCVINAWSRSGVRDAAGRASQILIELQKFKGKEEFGVENATALLSAYSTPEEAEAILDKMFDAAKDVGDLTMMPNSITCTAYINCLAKYVANRLEGDNGETILKAEALLKRMIDLYSNGASDAKPSKITYNALINVIAKSNCEDSGQRAEKYLDLLENEYLAGDETMKPDNFTFTSVIDAYARQGNGPEAERILMRLLHDCKDKDLEALPFSATINAYASCGNPQDAERIMTLKEKLHNEGWSALAPDAFSFSGVINAYMNSNRRDRVDKCLEILNRMRKENMYNPVAYTAVIQGLSLVRQSWTEPIAIKLLSEMWSYYNEGHTSMKPTTTIYSSLINLFAKSRDSSSRRKAVELLTELEHKFTSTGDSDFQPDNITYNACLSSFSKARNAKEAMKAEEILNRMQKLHDEGFPNVCPDSFSMTSVCAAWANSGADPQKCENILNSMQHLYENGNVSMKPSRVAFGAVVNAWSKAGNVERAEDIVHHMEQFQGQEYEDMTPNHVIYNSLISAYANSRSEDAIDKVESILQKMIDMKSMGKLDASPTRITFNSVLSVYQRSANVQNVSDKAAKILNQMEKVS